MQETSKESKVAVRIKDQSTLIKSSSSEMPIYKVPMKQTLYDDKKNIAKYVVRTRLPEYFSAKKVLMLVGPSGSGKTTLIDGMVNNLFEVNWKDNFRLTLVTESTAKSQPYVCPTNFITAYTIYPMHGSKLQFPLTIIDTPGFGNTERLVHDKIIIKQIKDFFHINGIKHLNGIGFVVQGYLAKLTPLQKHTFQLILSIFGKDLADNLFMMTTFADDYDSDPPVMAAFAEAKIEFKKFYKFDNSAIFASNTQNKRMFWEMSFNSFKTFFNTFEKAKGVNPLSTKKVLDGYEQVERTAQHIQTQIYAGAKEKQALIQKKEILQDIEIEIDLNKTFTYTTQVTKKRRINLPSGQYANNCCRCIFTCHKNCGMNDENMHGCLAIDGDGNCHNCPAKCSWQHHKSQPYYIEEYTETEEKTIFEQKDRYLKALQRKERVNDSIGQINDSLSTIKDDIVSKTGKVQQALEHLDRVALKQNPLLKVEFLDLLIETESMQRSPGYQARIKIYESSKKIAEIIEKAKSNPTELQNFE